MTQRYGEHNSGRNRPYEPARDVPPPLDGNPAAVSIVC